MSPQATTKYKNEPTRCHLNHPHPSRLEMRVCLLILAKEQHGEVRLLQWQDHVYLTDGRLHCIPDFKVEDMKTGEVFWIEAKGMETNRFRDIVRLWRHYGPGKLEIYKANRRGQPCLVKTIIPEPQLKLGAPT
jgi:hypothetical protein